MAVDENTSSSTGKHEDNLETMIAGIDSRVAEALPRIGIHRLADLAESTPGELAKALRGMGIYRKHIEVEDWIGQAKQKLAERKIDAHSSSKADTTAMPNTQASGNQLDDWNLQAEFALYFENRASGQGEETWQTRVWKTRVRDRECDKEITFVGIEPHLWVDWILQQADLPVDVESDLIASETPVSPATVTPNPAQVSILDVEVEPKSLPDVRNKTLMTSIRFTVSGVNAEMLTAENMLYQILMLIVDQSRGLTKLIASEQGLFQPEQSVHTHQLEFPIPDLGRYELQTVVLIQSQTEMMAIYRGPNINVIP
jgi:hypothetical protein